MSSLEWRREQPRVEPPMRDPVMIALQCLFFAAVAADASIFVANGSWYMLIGPLIAGHIGARNV